MWLKFMLYPLGMFVLWQIIFIIEQLSLEFLNAPQIIVAIIALIINCGMQILIGYKVPQLAPKYKFVASITYIILFTFFSSNLFNHNFIRRLKSCSSSNLARLFIFPCGWNGSIFCKQHG